MSDQLDRLSKALSDRYAVEREVGAGGMATVYLAQDLKHDRKVAVKVLHPELAASLGPTRFLNEIKVTAGLSHPHILPLHDSGEADGFLYYVMPYVEGETLRHRLRRERVLPIDQSVRIVRDVADALAKAHAAGIVHRDIKPDNVLLSGKHAVVADFGVAKAVSASQDAGRGGMTQLGTALGTPMYMAPEQAAGDPDTDHRADIYALGIMAYEMLTGALPFDAKTPQAMLAAHVSVMPDPVRTRRASVPERLEQVIMRCLAKEPADRWPNAGELAEALEDVSVTGVSMTPARTSAVDIASFVRHSSPMRVGLTFAATSLVALGMVYLLMIQLGLPDWTFWSAIALAATSVAMGTGAAWFERRGTPGWTWGRARMVIVVVTTLFLLAVGGNAGMRAMGIGPAGTLVSSGVLDTEDRLILAQFENHTPDSAVGETVTELLRIDLAQSPTVTLVEGQRVTEALRRMQRDPASALTTDLAIEIAEREGVKAVVTGEVRTLGGEFVVSARLMSVNRETLAAARESGAGAEIVEAVDRLSATLRERIGESLKTIRADAPLAQVTTASTEALRTYARAERIGDLGETQRAIELLEDAIRQDSLFAMAHRKLGIQLSNQGRDPERAQQAFTHAYELRDRLTERERYLAEAAYNSYVVEDTPAAIASYESLLEKYPADPIALNNLGVSYRGVGRHEDAEAIYRRAVTQGVALPSTYTNLIDVQSTLGMKDSALATLDRFTERYPDHPQGPYLRAMAASSEFRHAEAEQMMLQWRERMTGSPASQAGAAMELGALAANQGRLREATELFGEGYDGLAAAGLQAIPQPRALFLSIVESFVDLLYLGETDRALGRIDSVRAALDYANLPLRQRNDLEVAEIYARAGRADEARELIRLHESDIPNSGDDARSGELWAAYAMVSMAEERYDDALREMLTAVEKTEQCVLCFRAALGDIYMLAGQRDSAIAVYERYLTAPVLNRAQFDPFTLWGVLIRLGEAYEAAGNEERAVEMYDRFLSLWPDPDGDLEPIVDDVRGRIARLVGEP